MNLTNQIKALLNEFELHHIYKEQEDYFELNIELDNTVLSILLYGDDSCDRLNCFVRAPFVIPKEKYTAVFSCINKIHENEFNPAHLFIDEEAGRLMAQNIIDISNFPLNKEVFRQFLMSPCCLIDDYFKEIMRELINPSMEDIALSFEQGNMVN